MKITIKSSSSYRGYYTTYIVSDYTYDSRVWTDNADSAITSAIRDICGKNCKVVPIDESEVQLAYNEGYSWGRVTDPSGIESYYKFSLPSGY